MTSSTAIKTFTARTCSCMTCFYLFQYYKQRFVMGILKFTGKRTITVKVWEKILFSTVFASVISALRCNSWEAFYDTFTLLFIYTVWISCFLPGLYKKLTVKFIRDVITVLSQLFFADVFVFGGYRTLRRYMGGVDVTFDSTEQRGYVFIMNCFRLIVVCYCILTSIPAFLQHVTGSKTVKKRKRHQY